MSISRLLEHTGQLRTPAKSRKESPKGALQLLHCENCAFQAVADRQTPASASCSVGLRLHMRRACTQAHVRAQGSQLRATIQAESSSVCSKLCSSLVRLRRIPSAWLHPWRALAPAAGTLSFSALQRFCHDVGASCSRFATQKRAQLRRAAHGRAITLRSEAKHATKK